MNQYKDYTLEDFVLDAHFQNWVRFKRPAEINFWQNYLQSNALQINEVMQAKALLESVYSHYETHINDVEIDMEIMELLNKVRAEKESSSVLPDKMAKLKWHKQIFRKLSIYQAAAIILIVLGLGWSYNHYNFPKSNYERLTVGKMLKEVANFSTTDKVIELADGSKIILHPNSKVSFPIKFVDDKREIFLSGEAFFQVSKDPKRPFLVYANEIVTKVLGTSFTIKAPTAAQKTTVEVKEGKVSVFRQADFTDKKDSKVLQSTGLVVTTNQKVVFEKESSHMLKTLSDSPEVIPSTAPKSFDFVNAPASEILNDLKEAYQVDIIYDADLLRDCPVTAALSRQSLVEKLDIVCEVIEAHYEMLDGKVVVYSKGCKN